MFSLIAPLLALTTGKAHDDAGNNSPGPADAELHCMVVGSCILGKVCSSNSDCGEQLCVARANCMDEQPSQEVAEVARDGGDAGGATASASPPPPYATGGTAYGGYPGGSGDGIH